MNVLDLFSGIGGMSLGLERAGMKTVAFCEIEPFCQKILRKHWPDTPIYDDITKLHKKDLDDAGITIDLLCGGFPCQDISGASRTVTGLAGERSGLFYQILRLVSEYRRDRTTIPWILLENVPNLRLHGIDQVISALEQEGYTCWPTVVGAWSVGAPHKRERVWIVCHSPSTGLEKRSAVSLGEPSTVQESERSGWWECEPSVCRVANGIPDRVDRLKSLGNAVVPLIPEIIGRWIIQQQTSQV